ncbi:MAG TPA: hypothetical protein VF766_06060 [Pyrinomonadaceae bacterium]
MSTATATTAQRFLRRTTLHENEYHTNFRKLDRDVISALVSEEASRVTSQMSKIYLSLINAPPEYWERDGVLRFEGCEREGKYATAWEQLTSLVGVASATARKALQWMSAQGVIGYYAGRNGAGIRIFINRAASSIGHRPQSGQKNLRLVHTSSGESHTSKNDMPFKDSFADREVSDTDKNPRAPKTGAPETETCKKSPKPDPASPNAIFEATLVERLVSGLVPHVRAAASREHERTREWFITHALPKAIRVSQRSAYDVLRAHGLVNEPRPGGSNGRSPGLDVGRQRPVEIVARLLADEEITELAESCVALLEAQGQSIERSLSEMSVEAGGFLLPEDAPKVRERAESLIRSQPEDRLNQ